MVKNPPANTGDIRDADSLSRLGRSGGGPGNTLQYSFLENPIDREARRATAHRVTKNQRRQKRQHSTAPEMKKRNTGVVIDMAVSTILNTAVLFRMAKVGNNPSVHQLGMY